MKIMLEPTKSFEVFKGVQFRLYKGHTDTGIPIQMLGMFRIADPLQRAQFHAHLADATLDNDHKVTPLLDMGQLLT